jgi:hypothetical protein
VTGSALPEQIHSLTALLDERAGLYRDLKGAGDVKDYGHARPTGTARPAGRRRSYAGIATRSFFTAGARSLPPSSTTFRA